MDLRGVLSNRSNVRRSAGVVAWRVGQVVCGLCFLGALMVLVRPEFGTAGQVCAAALFLLGVFSLLTGRALMMVSARRPRRRRVAVY